MSAPTSPEAIHLEVMPEFLMPPDPDGEFAPPNPVDENVIGYLAVVEGEGVKKCFSASVEERTNFVIANGQPAMKRSTRFSVSGPEVFKGDGAAGFTDDARYHVMEMPQTEPPRTTEQNQAIVRGMIAFMMSVE